LERWPIAILVAAVLGLFAWRWRAVSPSGVLAGVAIAGVLALAPTFAPLVVFVVFVVAGSVSSRLGADAKRALGVMQEHDGRRTWVHALANAGPAAAIVGLSRVVPGMDAPAADLAATGTLAAMLSDTVASEWGTWLGGRPRSIITWREVPIGADGGVTAAGLLAAAIAGLVAGALAMPFHADPAHVFFIIGAAGFAGNLADSVLGATIEPWLGRHGGAWVNALASLVGGLTAWMLGRISF
jgi:uncharacterized protein (TIGR00297 family)